MDLEETSVNLVGIIYNGLVYGGSRYKNQQKLRICVKRLKLPSLEQKKLLETAYNVYDKTFKKAHFELRKAEKEKNRLSYQEYLKKRSNAVFEALNQEINGAGSINSACYSLQKRLEYASKQYNYERMVNDSRNLDTPIVFYACSYHSDCAKDHEAYQGKIYIDEIWESLLQNEPDLTYSVRAYIKNHQVETIQQARQDKPYLTTRPNCRHYFIPVSTEEVLSSSVRKILLTHGGYRSETKLTETQRQARQYKNAYVRRLRIHTKLKKIMPCERLEKAILDDHKLIRKWTQKTT